MKYIVIFYSVGVFTLILNIPMMNANSPSINVDYKIIEKRIQLMRKDVLHNFKILRQYTHNQGITEEEAIASAIQLKVASSKFLQMFPKGTGRPQVDANITRSLSRIWEDWSMFQQSGLAMKKYAAMIEASVGKDNSPKVEKLFRLIGKEGCSSCHKSFRGPKSE